MELTGTIAKLFEPVSGTSKAGNAWTKQEFILEYIHGEWPKQILLSTMDTNRIGHLTVGAEIRVDLDFTVREWTNSQGVTKYFNEPRIWKDGIHSTQPVAQAVQQQYQQTQPAPVAAPVQSAPAVSVQPSAAPQTGDGLPF